MATLPVLCAFLVIVLACSEERSVENAQEVNLPVAEVYPEFEGGVEAFNAHIMKEIEYPLQARQAGVEGRVHVEFIVDTDGSISYVDALRGIGAGCDEEAERVIKSLPKFKPATQNGKPATARMVVPIVFQLKASETNPDNSRQGMVIIEELQQRDYNLKVEANYENGEWTGSVYDRWYEGLPDANIVVPGTTTRTTSGPDGSFKLKTEPEHAIVVSFVGYTSMAMIDETFFESQLNPPKNWEKTIDVLKPDSSRYWEHRH